VLAVSRAMGRTAGHRWRRAGALAAAGLMAVTLAACGGDEADASKVTVTFRQFGDDHVQENYLKEAKAEFERAHPGTTIDLQPIIASNDDYPTKLQLQMRSPRTSPDLVYEDTFLINSDIEAGYLRPLDDYIAAWPDWNNFEDTAKNAGRALDGKTYGIPTGTDTRGIWFNKEILAKAGLPADWQPTNWNDLLTAARAIKAAVPGVIPLSIYAGATLGEASSMQGFEMLLYGTGDTLYDHGTQKWVVGSQGFRDALQFIQTVYSEGLGATPQQVLTTDWNNTVGQEQIPQGKVAIAVEGSWLSNKWGEGGANPWPQWSTVMGWTAMPTQNGQAPGKVSMSGGWTWAIPQNADNPDLAWEFSKMLNDKAHQLKFAIDEVQIPVRTDVAADSSYAAANPSNEFFASLVPITTYRPAYAVYPRISNEIQVATESVITGSADVATAATHYDNQVRTIAGDAVVAAAGS
jgi:multiple sugar transport system substrate-binding protein